MTHLFADPSARTDGQEKLLEIRGGDYNHIRNVLRMKPGEEVSVSFGDGLDYIYTIKEYTEQAAVLRLLYIAEKNTELPVRVILFQGIPKADRMDLIVQKTVELGVSRIVPVETARCVVRLDDSKKEKRRARWQSIAENAAGQCRRNVVPEVLSPMSFREAVQYAKESAARGFIPYEMEAGKSSRTELSAVRPGETIAVFIGPEGGFEESEVDMAKEAGFVPVSLGRRILRTETAAPAFLSFMIYQFELDGE